MKQVVIIGGGETFESYEKYIHFLKFKMHVSIAPREGKGWKANLQEDLGKGYQVINVKMPNPLNANYAEWSIYFGRILQHVEHDAVYVGHSLGGLFLLQYMNSPNLVPRATIFVSTPVEQADELGGFNLVGRPDSPFCFGSVHIFHSKDDMVVSPREAFILNSIFLDATLHMHEAEGHFYSNEHFPELVQVIKKAWRK